MFGLSTYDILTPETECPDSEKMRIRLMLLPCSIEFLLYFCAMTMSYEPVAASPLPQLSTA